MIIKNCPANATFYSDVTGEEKPNCCKANNLKSCNEINCTIKTIVIKCRESWGGRDTCNFQNHILKILDVRD